MKGEGVRTVITKEVQRIPIGSIAVNSRSAYLFSPDGLPKVAFPSIIRLKKEEINPVLTDIINGQTIDWKTTPEISKLLGYRGIFTRSLATMLDNPNSEETRQGFEMLDNDLKRFSPNIDLLKSDNFDEWFYKSFILGIHFHTNYSYFKKVVSKNKIPQADKYQKTIEEQLLSFKQVIENLQLADLPSYFRYCDSQVYDYEDCTKGKEPNWSASFLTGFLEKDEKTWERLKIGWGWEQINQAISFLPGITIENVWNHIRAAIGENLASNTDRPTEEIYDRENKDWPQAIKSFLLEVPKDNSIEWYEGDYPNLARVWKKDDLELPGFSVPKRHIPSTAIELLSRIGEVEEPGRFTDLLADIHELVKNKEIDQTAWLTTLIAIRAKTPGISGFVQETIEQWDSIPQIVRDTLSDKRPGHIWLTKAGKIRITDEMKLTAAFPLYTSSCEVAQAQPVEVVDFKKKEETKIEPDISIQIPLIGKIGAVNNGNTSVLINKMFSKLPEKELKSILDEDRLLGENDSHVQKWAKIPGADRQHLLYHSKLNLNDPLIKQAASLGVEAVYVNGNQACFVLNGKITGSESQNIAIQGNIKENGELSINGTGESFIGEAQNLYLANLALHCVNKPKRGCLYADKQTKAGVNQMISSWNRTTRNGLPEIRYHSSTQEASIIAITIPDVKETIFVSYVNLPAA